MSLYRTWEVGMTKEWLVPVRTFVQAHAGIVPIAKIVEHGGSRRDAYRLVDAGEFELIMPGILRSTHWPLGREQLIMAACWRNPAVSVAWTTASREWRF